MAGLEMEAIVVALIISVPAAIVSPILVAWLTSNQRRKDRMEDYRRQDEVAAKAAEAARLLAQAQRDAAQKAAEAATLLLASNKVVADTAKLTNDKLDTIHTLVNSNLTASMQGELNALRIGLRGLLENVELKTVRGVNKTTTEAEAEAEAEIKGVKRRIAELEVGLSERLKQSMEIEKAQNAKLIVDIGKA